MFTVSRHASKHVLRPWTRSFAQVVNDGRRGTSQEGSSRKTSSQTRESPPVKVPVREDHGLYAFFRRKKGDHLAGEDRYEVFETPEEGQMITGRAWEASELRNKSFKDLHTLWYVALREKNVLATQREETRRMGVTHPALQFSQERSRNCRKTMARIKLVLNERRLAFEGALKIAEREQATAKQEHGYDKEDEEILKFQLEQEPAQPHATQGRRKPSRRLTLTA